MDGDLMIGSMRIRSRVLRQYSCPVNGSPGFRDLPFDKHDVSRPVTYEATFLTPPTHWPVLTFRQYSPCLRPALIAKDEHNNATCRCKRAISGDGMKAVASSGVPPRNLGDISCGSLRE